MAAVTQMVGCDSIPVAEGFVRRPCVTNAEEEVM